MIGSSYEQMKKAMLALGRYSMAEGTYVNAEILAYSVGIDLVKDYFKKILGEMLIDTAEDYGLDMFEDLFLIKMSPHDLTGRRKQIKTYLSLPKGFFDFDFWWNQILRCGSTPGYSCGNGQITFFGINQEAELFRIQLCSFLSRYNNFLGDYNAKGPGKSWDKKDKESLNWNVMDAAMMSFCIHDTL